jgi:hypothetical protein
MKCERNDMERLSEEQGIRGAIAHYADGIRTGNVETLKRGFHESRRSCAVIWVTT